MVDTPPKDFATDMISKRVFLSEKGITFVMPSLVIAVFLVWLGFDGVFLGWTSTFTDVLLLLAIAAIYICLLIGFLAYRRLEKAFSYGLALALGGLALGSGALPVRAFEALKIHLFESRDHGACLSSGLQWAPGKTVAVCEKQTFSNGNIDAFIYDSSGEVMLPPAQRSKGWQLAMEKLIPEAGLTWPELSKSVGGNIYYLKYNVTSDR